MPTGDAAELQKPPSHRCNPSPPLFQPAPSCICRLNGGARLEPGVGATGILLWQSAACHGGGWFLTFTPGLCRREHTGDPGTSGAHLQTPAIHASSMDVSSPEYQPPNMAGKSLVAQWADLPVEPSRKSSHPAGSSGSSKATGVMDVPDEILEAILVHAVRGHGDLRTISGTCRRWHSFSQLDCTWKRMTIRGWGHRADIVQVPIDKETNSDWKEYYKARLQTHIPELNYLRFQDQMTVSIRSILINWLLAVIDELQEDSEAAYLPTAHHQTVAYLDRYCASLNQVIETSELQMIGAACAVMALHVGKSVMVLPTP